MSRIALNALLLLAVALLVASPHAARAAESYDNCTGFITSVPATITTQGTWCLKQDLATGITSGAAITIDNNNITIDCNNFKLGGLAAGVGTLALGVSSVDRTNATVRNCSIRGFKYGLSLTGAAALTGGHLIEDNRFDGNSYRGIFVEGDGSIVRRNRVLYTGGSTNNAFAYGIRTTYSVDIMDNLVLGTAARAGGGGSAYGIYTSNNPDGSISRNRIRSTIGDGANTSYGVFNEISGRITLRDNQVVSSPALGYWAIRCGDTNGRTVGNTVGGFSIGIVNCGGADNDVTQ